MLPLATLYWISWNTTLNHLTIAYYISRTKEKTCLWLKVDSISIWEDEWCCCVDAANGKQIHIVEICRELMWFKDLGTHLSVPRANDWDTWDGMLQLLIAHLLQLCNQKIVDWNSPKISEAACSVLTMIWGFQSIHFRILTPRTLKA